MKICITAFRKDEILTQSDVENKFIAALLKIFRLENLL